MPGYQSCPGFPGFGSYHHHTVLALNASRVDTTSTSLYIISVFQSWTSSRCLILGKSWMIVQCTTPKHTACHHRLVEILFCTCRTDRVKMWRVKGMGWVFLRAGVDGNICIHASNNVFSRETRAALRNKHRHLSSKCTECLGRRSCPKVTSGAICNSFDMPAQIMIDHLASGRCWLHSWHPDYVVLGLSSPVFRD